MWYNTLRREQMKQDYKVIETERLFFKPFSALTKEEKKEIAKSWKNPFNARFNAINKPLTTAEEISTRKEPTFSLIGKNFEAFKDTNYFRAVFNKETKELIGVCRFGMYYELQQVNTWDFALFNVFLKHWGNGYGVEILRGVCDFAKNEGVKYIYAGASNDNFSSYHAMIYSGLKYCRVDDDEDFEFRRDLTKEMPTKVDMEEEWQKHIRRYIRKFGKKRYNRLDEINKLIKEMVQRIHAGENEDELVKIYYEKCNKIEEFPERSEGD